MYGGLTYLIPNAKRFAHDPERYRPVTVYSYKISIYVLSEIYKHLEATNPQMKSRRAARKARKGVRNRWQLIRLWSQVQ